MIHLRPPRTAHERRWQEEFTQVQEQIPEEWLVEIEGQTYFKIEYRDEKIVQLYQGLLLVGYAKGWMP